MLKAETCSSVEAREAHWLAFGGIATFWNSCSYKMRGMLKAWKAQLMLSMIGFDDCTAIALARG